MDKLKYETTLEISIFVSNITISKVNSNKTIEILMMKISKISKGSEIKITMENNPAMDRNFIAVKENGEAIARREGKGYPHICSDIFLDRFTALL